MTDIELADELLKEYDRLNDLRDEELNLRTDYPNSEFWTDEQNQRNEELIDEIGLSYARIGDLRKEVGARMNNVNKEEEGN